MVGLILGAFALLFYLNRPAPTPPLKEEDFSAIKNSDIKKLGYGIAVDNPKALEVGLDILKKGGNAVDAAIAVAYVLGVVEPYGSGIGGGGIMLVHPQNEKEPIVYDYRETAPSELKKGRTVGIPGFVRGMEEIHQDFGTMDLEKLIEPSIELAEEGFEVSRTLHNRLSYASYRLPVGKLPHFFPGGKAILAGKEIKQEELAKTLRKIQEKGSDVFYKGEIGEQIDINNQGIRLEDLGDYKTRKTKAISTNFQGYKLHVPPPPSGGVMLIQSLLMADYLDVGKLNNDSSDYVQLMGEINRISNKERHQYVGDPEFEDIPTEKLISEEHIAELAANVTLEGFSEEHTTESDTIEDEFEEGSTTHFVVIDKNGMMVSATNTLSNFFGSGYYVAGFFLNNQLDNFSTTSRSPNRIEPGKRPFSHIAPTILAIGDKPVIGIGSSGGSRIVTVLSQVLSKSIMLEQSLETAVKGNRFYMNVSDNLVALESTTSKNIDEELSNRGYRIDRSLAPIYFGGVEALMIDYTEGHIYGASDPRRDGVWKAYN